jgi:competence protein ComEC
VKHFDIGQVVCSEAGIDRTTAKSLHEELMKRNTEVHFARAGEMIDSFEEMRLYFLYPEVSTPYQQLHENEINLNNSSITFMLKYREFEMLFPGDIENESEKTIADRFGSILNADILKAAHHGSITSSTSAILSHIRPDQAIISCGKNNKFGHPSNEVVKRLLNLCSNIHRTDLNGAVTILTDGYEVTVRECYVN